MRETADVAIVGGGVVGVSIAYHLARTGRWRITLIEKDAIGAGATGRSSAIIRQHYTIEIAARTALLSLRTFQRFADEVGGHSGFVACGYLILWGAADSGAGQANVAMQQALGVRTELVRPEDMRRLIPELRTDDLALGAWEPESGYADPVGVASAYACRARELGVRILQGEMVVTVRAAGGRVVGVRTDRRELAAPVVVNAAGLWAGPLAQAVGVEIPIKPVRHQIAILERPSSFRGSHPVVVDTTSLTYLRPEGLDQLLVGDSMRRFGHMPEDPDAYPGGLDPARARDLIERTVTRLPVMEHGVLQGGYSGLYDMTPDGQFIVDRVDDPQGLYLACGFSGHGFKHAPAIGALMAELITEGRTRTVDVSPWRLSRFSERRLLVAAHPYSAHVARESSWT